MGLPRRRGCTSPATVFSAIVLLALTTWATLLYRVFASPPHGHPPPSLTCASEERLLWSARVVLADHTLPASIHVSSDGKIKAVNTHQQRSDAQKMAERLGIKFEPWGTEAISPGVVDAYAHLVRPPRRGRPAQLQPRPPPQPARRTVCSTGLSVALHPAVRQGAVLEGTSRSWEGFASGTQAAAAGGVTTVIDLPSQSLPATTTANALRRKAAAARGKLHADVGFWGAIVPENSDDPDTLLELLAQGAVRRGCSSSPRLPADSHRIMSLTRSGPVSAQLGLSAVIAMGMQPDTQARPALP